MSKNFEVQPSTTSPIRTISEDLQPRALGFKTLGRKAGRRFTSNVLSYSCNPNRACTLNGDQSNMSKSQQDPGNQISNSYHDQSEDALSVLQSSEQAASEHDFTSSPKLSDRERLETPHVELSQTLLSENCQDASDRQVTEHASSVSLSTVPNPTLAISSPGLNTFRRAGAELAIAMRYSSQNMWDLDTDESEFPIEDLAVVAQSSKSKAPQSIRMATVLIREASPTTHTGEKNMDLHFKGIKLSPTITIRSSPTQSKRDASTSSRYLTSRRSSVTNNQSTSIWDPEDDEFDRWPGQETLDRIGTKFTSHRGMSKHSVRSRLSTSSEPTKEYGDNASTLTGQEAVAFSNTDYANLSEQQHADLIHELLDKECGNPYGPDVNDELMQQYYSNVPSLPASTPARYMHVLNWEACLTRENDLVQNAFPRLCDAVATVLYLTSPKCLDEFLNPDVKIFEWRRDGNCLMIRRNGTEVIVGTYHNFATNYIWTYFVRSSISFAGTWKETYAAVASGVTTISADGIDFDKFESDPSALGISPTDEKYALYMGRELASFMLREEVWDYRRHYKWSVSWEADGVATVPKEHDRYQLWKVKEDDDLQ